MAAVTQAPLKKMDCVTIFWKDLFTYIRIPVFSFWLVGEERLRDDPSLLRRAPS